MHRDGLNSRSQHPDQVQIHIGKGFDFDSEVDDLRKHVGRIKQVRERNFAWRQSGFDQEIKMPQMSMQIDEERKEQGRIINSLEDAMERARDSLKRTMMRLKIQYQRASGSHLLILLAFAVFLLLGVYIIAKVYRLGRNILS